MLIRSSITLVQAIGIVFLAAAPAVRAAEDTEPQTFVGKLEGAPHSARISLVVDGEHFLAYCCSRDQDFNVRCSRWFTGEVAAKGSIDQKNDGVQLKALVTSAGIQGSLTDAEGETMKFTASPVKSADGKAGLYREEKEEGEKTVVSGWIVDEDDYVVGETSEGVKKSDPAPGGKKSPVAGAKKLGKRIRTAVASTAPAGSARVPSLFPLPEKKAREALTALGGKLEFEAKFPKNVISVSLSGIDTVTDADLQHLKALKKLAKLDIGGCEQVTDAGIKEHVKGLTSLRELSLSGTKVTDDGAKELKALTNLTDLNLNNIQVTDTGLKDISALTNLKRLLLFGANVTDSGAKDLKPLTKLTILNLGDTKVTNAALAELKALTELSRLTLAGTAITDKGLPQLEGLTKLAFLDLERTRVTAKGVAKLKKAIEDKGGKIEIKR